ncbi:MAG: phosphoribosylglycinamide synthetase C domain-containing protein, partial [Rhodospirillales bacterium]
SPAPVVDAAMSDRIMAEIVLPTVEAMKAEGCPYSGVLFVGLMINEAGPRVIEYNVRFGDPECQVLMMRLMSDILPALLATADGVLDDFALQWYDDTAMVVVMAADGYPGSYSKGTVIRGLKDATEGDQDRMIFHAGTALEDGQVVAAGGRVLGVAGMGPAIEDARAKAYATVDRIDWPEGFCRRDIGWRALKS